jgi:hypothetical protein
MLTNASITKWGYSLIKMAWKNANSLRLFHFFVIFSSKGTNDLSAVAYVSGTYNILNFNTRLNLGQALRVFSLARSVCGNEANRRWQTKAENVCSNIFCGIFKTIINKEGA